MYDFTAESAAAAAAPPSGWVAFSINDRPQRVAPPSSLLIGAAPSAHPLCVRLQVVMWLNQNFLLPEGVDSTEVSFTSLRGGGLLSISMAASGQVPHQMFRLLLVGMRAPRKGGGRSPRV